MEYGKVLLALFVLLPAVFCSGAILRVGNITMTPDEVYAGAFGYITLNVENSGTSIAEDVNLYYYIEGSTKRSPIGDISSGSSAQVSIPFSVADDAGGTIQLQTVDIYYQDESSTSLKKTTVSYPITVKNLNPITLKTISNNSVSAAPGERMKIVMRIESSDSTINNVAVKAQNNSGFSIFGTERLLIGNLEKGVPQEFELELITDSNLTQGKYNIPIVLEYQNSINQRFEETMYVGPVNIVSADQQFRVELAPMGTTEVGSEVQFKLTVQNKGTEATTVSVKIDSTDQFTPIGMQTLYFDSVQPGQSESQIIKIGISPSIASGYYSLPIALESESGGSGNYTAGISVQASAQLRITADTSEVTPRIQIANTGNTNIRSTYVKVKDAQGNIISEALIGTLDVDDFDYVDVANGGQSVEIEISFKDNNNAEHVLDQTVDLSSGASVFMMGNGTMPTGMGSAANNNTAARGMQRGGGGLFGLTGTGKVDITGIAMYVGIAIVVIVAAYFGYKKYVKKGAR